MILTSRLLLVAILVFWQAFPALAYTYGVGLPAWMTEAKALCNSDLAKPSAALNDLLSDPVELADESSIHSGPLLALLPEATDSLVDSNYAHYFDPYHSVLTGSSEFLYRDRGPPRLLQS